ncbi:DegV family protein [Clostridia bacterium]|nr:DegV family protein [Clostridia bacterium]
MSVKIIADTSCDTSALDNELENLLFAPFQITICGDTFLDTEKTRTQIVEAMDNCPEPARTACPSPSDFLQYFEGEEKVIFVVCISSELSGTYSSARTAREQFLGEHPDHQIFIIDSLSASAAEAAVAHFLLRQLESGESDYEKIAQRVQEYAKNLKTVFVLEDLSNLMKNGRLSKIQGMLASLLNIKPILGTNGKGEIMMIKNARGTKKALNELFNTIKALSEKMDLSEKEIFISHCDAPERVEKLRARIEKEIAFKTIHILETNGLSTVYASDKGVVVAF